MTRIERSVGIDCGKDFLDAHAYPMGDVIRVTNDDSGHEQLTEWITARHITHVGIEASGGYERPIRNHLLRNGLIVHVFDPKRVRHFAKAKGRRAKNDTIDARIIAEFTANCADQGTTICDRVREHLADLVKARKYAVERRATLETYCRSVADDIRELFASDLAAAKQTIQTMDAAIEKCIDDNDSLADAARLLKTAPGVGDVTSAVLLARLPELGSLSPAKIAALAGVAPFDDDSGNRRGARHIAGGRADVRSALYMAVVGTATRGNGVLGKFYKHLIAEGKLPKVALVACMRKLLVRLNVMMANHVPWSDNPSRA